MPRVLVAPVRALVQRLGPHVEDVEPVTISPGDRDGYFSMTTIAHATTRVLTARDTPIAMAAEYVERATSTAAARGRRSPETPPVRSFYTVALRLALPLLVAFCCCVARADDWPQWFGPKRDGVWRENEGILPWPRKS